MPIVFSCTCGKTLAAPDRNAGRKVRCPYCRTMVTIPLGTVAQQKNTASADDPIRGSRGAPARSTAPPKSFHAPEEVRLVLPRVMRANRKIAGRTCPVCQTEIRLGDEVQNCLECGSSHHLLCWGRHRACGHCAPAPGLAGRAELSASRSMSGTAWGPAAPESSPYENTLSKKAKRRLGAWVSGCVALSGCGLLLAILWVNYASLQRPLKEVLSSDERNQGIEASVHYGNWVRPRVLTFNLLRLTGDNSRADVFRVFLQYAHKVRGRRFDVVELAFRGRTKFLLPGSAFGIMGEEYEWQNPLHTMRTFPEKLENPDGTRAFPEWTGGLLGVLAKQMEDFEEFHDRWYVSEL